MLQCDVEVGEQLLDVDPQLSAPFEAESPIVCHCIQQASWPWQVKASPALNFKWLPRLRGLCTAAASGLFFGGGRLVLGI